MPVLNPVETQLDRWKVVIFNNDHTPYELVVAMLIHATGCDQEEAEIETWEAHHYGKTPVHFSSEEECQGVAIHMATIGVKAEVSREWEEE